MIRTAGSVCSGIEAASVAWGFDFQWFSEIEKFPSELLKEKYPTISNLGDMRNIPELLLNKQIVSPDLICGGTPCQAFSLSGLRQGLNDDRGNLALKFVEIIEANDKIRQLENKPNTIVFWENVEGVLSDKTNAFGCMISALAGLDNILIMKRWPNAGLLRGKTRNVAWRVLDAKYFGIPQQRKRLYLLASGKDFYPENVLFELGEKQNITYPETPLTFVKDNCSFEVFRTYTDCLYAAYGTKWNGNAAAYNGSLFVAQDGKLRRLFPLECERLMGFPDNYTNISTATKTTRYKALGNSWAIPVIQWIGKRLIEENQEKSILEINQEGFIDIIKMPFINSSNIPLNPIIGNIFDVLSSSAPNDIYLSERGCQGILRRAKEKSLKINERLEEMLIKTGKMDT